METTKKKGQAQKWITLILMMMSMGTIYVLPYMKGMFFTPLQEAMGLMDDTTAYGTLTSVYGIMNLICYLPSGIIADKFDAKKLLVFSMISTGVLGLYMSTWPGYDMLLIIHILFGVTTVLTFWSSSVKVVNMLAASDEQGQMFGFLEGGRGILGIALNTILLALFAFASSKVDDVEGVTWVVVAVSVYMILIGVALGFLLPKGQKGESTNTSFKDSLIAMGHAFKQPITWCISGIIFCCCCMTTTGSYFAPYLEGGCAMAVVMTSTFQMIRGNGAQIIAAPVAGSISKKMGRSSGVTMAACLGLAAVSAILFVVPASPALLFPIMGLMLLFSYCYSSNRAVYWALIDEAGTPKNMVGSVTGIASLIGFLPDTFLNTVYGSIIDNNSFEAAYNKIFMFCTIVAVIGLCFAIYANKIVKKHQAEAKAAAA
ncbi:MAG TPA: MFS transporter [Candidatus Avilachnospira avistercoris]|nr:MFS transporter [Candidatus Avilachnospira avistercoris]